MPIPYYQLQSAFNNAKSQGLFPNIKDLREFSRLGNQVTGTREFDPGDVGLVGEIGAGLDAFLRGASEGLGLDVAGRRLGGFAGEHLFDNRELGEEVGQELGSQVLAFTPAIAGYALAPFTAGASIPVGNTLTGALTASQVSAQTGDPLRSLAAGTIAGFTPSLIGAGSKALGSVASRLPGGEAASAFLANNPLFGIPARATGSVAAGFGVDVGSDLVDIGLADERTLAELAEPEYWQAQVIGNLAFLPLDVQQAFYSQRAAQQRPLTSAERDTTIDAVDTALAGELFNDPVKRMRSVEERTERDVDESFDDFFSEMAAEELRLREEIGFGRKVNGKPLADLKPLEDLASDLESGFAIEIEAFRQGLDQLPSSREEYFAQLESLNRVKQILGQEPVDDAVIRGKTQRHIKDGLDLYESEQRALQEVKNEVAKAAVEGRKPDEATALGAARVMLKDNPKVLKEVEAVFRTGAKDDQLMDDVATVLRRDLPPDEMAQEVKRAVGRARTRNKKVDTEPETPQPKVKREIDLNQIEERVNQLPKEVRNEVERIRSDYFAKTANFYNIDPYRPLYGAIEDWLDKTGGKDVKRLEKTIFSKDRKKGVFERVKTDHERLQEKKGRPGLERDVAEGLEYEANRTLAEEEFDFEAFNLPKPPFYVPGTKTTALSIEEVNRFFEDAVRGKNVVDVFSGSGFLSSSAAAAGATSSRLNVRNQDFLKVFKSIKHDPEGLYARIKKIESTLKSATDPEKFKTLSQDLQQKDPVALHAFTQALRKIEEVGAGRLPTFTEFTTKKPSLSLEGFKTFARNVTDFSSAEGWSLLQQATKGQLLIVDPPYAETKNDYVGAREYITKEKRITQYEENLRSGLERGAEFVIFDKWIPELVNWLTNNGFSILKFQRPRASFEEFIAFNAKLEPLRSSDSLTSVLLHQGHTPSKADFLSSEIRTLGSAFEQLTGAQLSVGQLVDPTGRVAGLSSRSSVQRALYINSSLPRKLALYSLLHEGFGHQFQKSYELNQLPLAARAAHENLLKALDQTPPNETARLLDAYAKSILDSKTYNSLRETLLTTAVDPSEALANFSALAAWDAFTNADPYKNLRYLPYPMARWAVEAMRFVRDLMRGLKAWWDVRVVKGEVEVDLWRELQGKEKTFREAVRKAQDVEEAALRGFDRLGLNFPGEVGRYRSEMVVDASRLTFDGNRALEMTADAMLLGATKVGREFGRKFADTFDRVFHRALRYPALEVARRSVSEEAELGFKHHRDVLGPLFAKRDEDGNIVYGNLRLPEIERDGVVSRVLDNVELNWTLSEIYRTTNVEDMSLGRLEVEKPEVYQRLMAGRSDEEIRNLKETVARFTQATAMQQRKIIAGLHQQAEVNLAILLRGLGMEHDGVLDLGKAIYGSYRDARRSGDYSGFNDILRINRLDQNVMMKFLEPVVKGIAQQEEFYRTKQHWVNERRWKRYHVSYHDGKSERAGRQSFDKSEDALAFVQEARKKGWKLFYPGSGFIDSWKGGRTDRTNLSELFELAEMKTVKVAVEDLHKAGRIDDETRTALLDSFAQLKAAVEAEGTTVGLTALGPERHFAPGREELDMAEQHLIWLGKASRAIPRLYTDAILRLEGKNPAVVNDADTLHMYDQIKEAVKNFREPDTDAGRNLLKASFAHYILFNMSTGLIEATSWPMWLSPTLVEAGASLVDSYKLPLKAAEAITKHKFTKKWDTDVTVQLANGKKVNAFELLTDEAAARMRIGKGRAAEAQEAVWTIQNDLGRLATGAKPEGLRAVLKPFGVLFDIGSKFYSSFVTVNNEIGFLSSFEFLRQRDYGGKKELNLKEFEELYQKSRDLTTTANQDAGRANRPVGLYNYGRTPAMVLDSLQSFNTAQLSNFYRRFVVGFNLGEAGKRFTPKERAQARKAFTQGFLTVAAGAGVLGALPFGKAFLALIEEHTELEPEEEIRKFIASISDDQEVNTFIANMAFHGMAVAAGSPYDLSGRMSMSGMAGFNELEGWSLKGFMGPVIGQWSDYVQGAENVLKGDLNKALEKSLPNGLKNLYQAVRNDGRTTDASGKVLFSPTDSERIGMGLGFRPTELSNVRDRQRLGLKSEQVTQARNQRARREIAQVAKEQGPLAARQLIQKRVQENPGLTSKAEYNGVIDYLNREKFGFDPRRSVNVQDDLDARQVAKTFRPLRAEAASELSRELFDLGNLLSLGDVDVSIDQRVESAILTDLFRNQTGLGPSAAQFLAQGLTRRDPPVEVLPAVQAFLHTLR